MKNIGIDIGKRKCVVCITDEKGKVLEETDYDNTLYHAKKFAKRMKKIYRKCHAVCESTGNMWIKTFEAFESVKIPIILANPFKTRAIAEARIKTDKIDARTLSNLLRGDLIPACHVAPWSIRSQKEVLRHRIRMVQDRTKVTNRMHALLDKYDIKIIGTSMTGVKNLNHISDVTLENDNDDYILQQCIRNVRYINSEIAKIDEEINSLASTNEDAKRIMSITGFDVFGATLIALEIDGIERFATPKKLVSWMGMCPTVHQSGNTTYHGKMRKDANRQVNWIMTQAANSAALHDERLSAVYERAKKRHPHGIAISHVANKMATIIWHLLNEKTLYDQRKDSLYARKLKKIKM